MSRIAKALSAHEAARQDAVPLVVSENALHPDVAAALSSDLAGRYGHTFYGGNAAAHEVLEAAKELAREVFGVRHAFLEPLSGNVADLAVLFAFSEPGDDVAMVPRDAGGYPLGPQWFQRRRVDLAVDPSTYAFDVEASVRVAQQAAMTFLGASMIPFPHPVEPFAGEARRLVYDGAHVLGLIATGAFQDPLREGAQVLIGSTHKSFPGPQGGMVLTNDDDLAAEVRWYLEVNDEAGIGLVDNPHPSRIAATGVVMELLLANPDYGKRVVGNARALAAAMADNGVPVRFPQRGHTASHQVLLEIPMSGDPGWRDRLDAAGVFTDALGRLGTAEATWRGLTETDMEEVADAIARVWAGTNPKDVRAQVAAVARRMDWLAR